MFLTDSAITTALANMLKVDQSTLPAYAAGIITSMHQAAYNEIVGQLVSRGFDISVIVNWDRGAEFENALSLFWCLSQLGGLHNYDNKFINLFDRRKDLATVQVYVSGAAVNPGDDPGTISSGGPDVSMDEFVQDPCDPRTGRFTPW